MILKKFLVPGILGTMKKTSDKILAYISQRGQASGKELSDYLGITDRAVRKQLRALLEMGLVRRMGKPPHVFYTLLENTKDGKRSIVLHKDQEKIIQENFLYITPRGERVEGVEGFALWCRDRFMNVEQKVVEYVNIFQKYESLKKEGLLSGKKKIVDTFQENVCLDDVFYADFYAWEVFGKTKLGQLLLYGKQSQNRKIMLEVIEYIRPLVERIVSLYKIDAIGFIPPTVKREVQFMSVLKNEFKLLVPVIDIVKVKTDIITPQKTLSKLRERIDNAEYSMVVPERRRFSRILLIDDAIGSGATLNQVACKIKKAGITKEVYGFAITGSVKGFDVISEI